MTLVANRDARNIPIRIGSGEMAACRLAFKMALLVRPVRGKGAPIRSATDPAMNAIGGCLGRIGEIKTRAAAEVGNRTPMSGLWLCLSDSAF